MVIIIKKLIVNEFTVIEVNICMEIYHPINKPTFEPEKEGYIYSNNN